MSRNIQAKYPDLIIRKIGSVIKALKHDSHTLPTVQIGETILYGKVITEGRIINELGLI